MEVSLGAVVILKELSENSLKIKVISFSSLILSSFFVLTVQWRWHTSALSVSSKFRVFRKGRGGHFPAVKRWPRGVTFVVHISSHSPVSKNRQPPVLRLLLFKQDHTSAPVIAKYDQLTRGTQQLVQAAAVIGQEVCSLVHTIHNQFVGGATMKTENDTKRNKVAIAQEGSISTSLYKTTFH